MKKITLYAINIILVVCCLFVSVSAAVAEPVTPLWDNTDMVYCNISFSGTRGTVLCDISAISSATSIEGTLTLYKDGVEIESWEIDVSTSYVTVIESFTGVKGSTYRLVLDADVTANGYTEPLDYSVSKRC